MSLAPQVDQEVNLLTFHLFGQETTSVRPLDPGSRDQCRQAVRRGNETLTWAWLFRKDLPAYKWTSLRDCLALMISKDSPPL